MSRVRLFLLMLAFCGLLAALVAASSVTGEATCAAQAENANAATSELFVTASQLAIPDRAISPSLPWESARELEKESRPLIKRVASFLPVLQWRGCAVLPWHRVSSSNWVCSFLPESKVCAVLSRFRI